MMLLPTGGDVKSAGMQPMQQPSRTYRMDFSSNRIIGMTDRLDAVKQAVYKILQTERFFYLIYSANYGSEFGNLVGAEPAFVRSELKRRITEALLQDDRIISVDDFKIEVNGDSSTVQFTVVSQYGSFDMVKEVRTGV